MRPLIAAIALVVTLLLPTPLRAQDLIISDPRFDSDQRDCIVMTLRLDEEQTDILDDLASVYALEIQEIFESLEEMVFEEDDDETDVERGLRIWREISARIGARQDKLFEDLALFLNEEQVQRVDRCRDRLRRFGITNGDLSGALPGGFSMGTDPVLLAIELGLPAGLDPQQTSAFERAMIAYDRAMARNIDSLLDDVLELAEEARAFEDDPFAGLVEYADDIDRIVEGAKALREEHQSLGLAIARTLPERTADRWSTSYLRALYPEPYRPIDSEVLIERLLTHPDLTPEEVETVLAISDELASRTDPIRKEWRREIDDFLRDFKLNIITVMSLDPDAIGAPFRERIAEVDFQFMERVIPQRVENDAVRELIQAMYNAKTGGGETAPAPAQSSN